MLKPAQSLLQQKPLPAPIEGRLAAAVPHLPNLLPFADDGQQMMLPAVGALSTAWRPLPGSFQIAPVDTPLLC